MTEEELEREARINLKRRFGEFFPQLTISYVMGAEPREKRIAELEKENAELKKKVENLQNYFDTQNCYRECAETWMKLTEAKKLLKQFLGAKNSEDTYKAEWEAEQFFKELDK